MADIGKIYSPRKDRLKKSWTRTIAKTAPNAAPADTPINPGSARGFLNKPCNVAPAKPKAEPTNNAKITLGNLILKKISYSIFDRSRVIRLIIDIEKLPLKRPKNRQNIKQKNKAIKIDFWRELVLSLK